MLAAQKRLDVQKKIGKGGVLGGSGTDYRSRSMKEVLAEVSHGSLFVLQLMTGRGETNEG